MSAKPLYQLKVTLQDFRPPIWRRLLISSDATFFDLHSLIQDAFGWEDYHLHSFRAYRNKGKKRIYIQDDETNQEWQYYPFQLAEELLPPIEERDEYYNELNTHLRQHINEEFPTIRYEYDFGDSWEHEIVLEKILHEVAAVPVVLGGKRMGPPEDSRGWIHDAEDIVAASHNKRSKFWQELVKNWGIDIAEDFASISEEFLSTTFGLDAVTITDPKERLKNYHR